MIQTSRLQLLPCSLQYFEALLQGNDVLADLLGIDIPEHWTEFPEVVLVAYDKLRNDPAMLGWFFYLVVHRADRRLIGAGGFKDRPDKNGIVEIGYEITASYREQGYGTEMAAALIRFAFSHSYVQQVVAHTEEEYNASVKILQKAGCTLPAKCPTRKMNSCGNGLSQENNTMSSGKRTSWKAAPDRFSAHPSFIYRIPSIPLFLVPY